MNCKKSITVEEIVKDTIKENSRLWIVEYEITHVGKGCAVIKANNAKTVENILLHDGIYNGAPKLYKITRIEEITLSPESMLLCEQFIDVNLN